MDKLGIYSFSIKHPLILHLLRPTSHKLSIKFLLNYLKPNFSEVGSNCYKFEKDIYAAFIRYIREVSSGRRIVKLNNILEYVTGMDEEPLLGFPIPPSIDFVDTFFAEVCVS